MTRCAREHGDFARLRFPGPPQVRVGHPDYVEEVLVRQNANFKKGDEVRRLSPLFGNGLFSSEGAFWLRQRRRLQPAFHRPLPALLEALLRREASSEQEDERL